MTLKCALTLLLSAAFCLVFFEGLLIHVPVVFELGKHCTFGHSFAVVGDAPELGEWDTDKSAPMQVSHTHGCKPLLVLHLW